MDDTMLFPLDADALERDFGVVTGPCGVRRLPPATRRLAARALAGEFGRAMRPAPFAEEFKAATAGLSPNQAYAWAIRKIAQEAPLRVLPEERLVGAAPYLEAAQHRVPGTEFGSISHTTLGFEEVLSEGYAGLRKRLAARLATADLDEEGRDLLTAMQSCLDSAALWQGRCLGELEARMETAADAAERAGYARVLESARRVPEHPPATFREALQALWFWWEFLRLCGNWSGLGRVDKLLGPYLQADLERNRITLDEARDLIAHFWIKGCEWTGSLRRPGSGDAQFYQNVILGGIDRDGAEVTNAVTYLVLDVVEELHISDFPVAVRVSDRTPPRLWQRIAEVQKLGGGIVAIYNEDLVIRALHTFGFPLAEAREFTNDGCWEVLVPGKSRFGYAPFDTLQLLQWVCGQTPEVKGNMNRDQLERDNPVIAERNRAGRAPEFDSFDELYAAFITAMRSHLAPTTPQSLAPATPWRQAATPPCPLVSLFVSDCLGRGRDYFRQGPLYSIVAPHASGLPDTANSLTAIQRLVYDQKRLTLRDLVGILRDDWQGHEPLRRELGHSLPFYGNDDPAADAMLRRLFDDYTGLFAGVPFNPDTLLRPPGISTFGRELQWAAERSATPMGTHAGEVLAPNLAPTPGTDRNGPTAVIASFCSMDFRRLPNGVPLDLKLHPSQLQGAPGTRMLEALLKTFVRLGGWYLQADVVDNELLKDAQRHPEKYPNLCVRVSGWSARFATLDKAWQDMIIARTHHLLGAA
jgi:formate C-acetyltransferase